MSPNKRKTILHSLLSAHLAFGCGPNRPTSHLDVFQPGPRSSPESPSSMSPISEPGLLGPGPGPVSVSPSNAMVKSTSSSTTQYSETGKKGSGSRPGPGPVSSSDAITVVTGGGVGVVVVKESEDPYEDFRDSMVEMIKENKILSKEDLHHLLRCFLRLNSPAHHHYILHAFFQVCDAFVSSTTAPKHSSQE